MLVDLAVDRAGVAALLVERAGELPEVRVVEQPTQVALERVAVGDIEASECREESNVRLCQGRLRADSSGVEEPVWNPVLSPFQAILLREAGPQVVLVGSPLGVFALLSERLELRGERVSEPHVFERSEESGIDGRR